MSATHAPVPMTPTLARELTAAGYLLPDTWPTNARVLTADQRREDGWRLQQPGSINNPDHPNWCANHETYFPAPRHIAPDGTPYIKAEGNARPVLVVVSRTLGPQALRVAPGARRPTWVVTDAPKGEVPEHLRRFLLKPGQRLTKGEKREVEALLVEPVHASRTTVGRAGSAVAVLGPRPKAGTPERTEWNRKYRELRKDHFKAYREARKGGRATARA